MRKALLMILTLALCGQFLANAQAIETGDRFWDGSTLFTVREIRMGSIVYMTDDIGDRELTLEAWPGNQGKYTLRPSRNAEDAPYGTDFGTHIDYVNQPDNKYLNIRKWMELLCGEYRSEGGKDVVIADSGGSYNGRPMPFNAVTFNGMVTGVLDFGSGGPYLAGKVEAVPTPDGLQLTEVKMNDGEPWYDRTVSYFNLKWAGAGSRFDFTSRILLSGVLHRYDKPLLRVMRNAILARHGYVFKSKDLKAYFEAQPWYNPAQDNAGIKLSLLEHLNLQLIQSAEREK